MAETVEIEELPAASVPSTSHVVPSQKSGSTEGLTVAQILSLALLSNISGEINNTGLPTRLRELAPSVADANDMKSGWSFLPAAGDNGPDNTKTFSVLTVYGNTAATGFQLAIAHDNTKTYRRTRTGSTWSGWSEIKDKLADLDARYQAAGSGTKYTDFLSMYIASPANGTYTVVQKAPIGMTLTHCIAILTSGTCTVRAAIEGTPAGAAANSVTTAETDVAYSTANVVAVDNDVKVIIGSVSSAVGLTVTLVYERTLDLH